MLSWLSDTFSSDGLSLKIRLCFLFLFYLFARPPPFFSFVCFVSSVFLCLYLFVQRAWRGPTTRPFYPPLFLGFGVFAVLDGDDGYMSIYIYIYVLVYVYIIYVIYLYTIESYLSPLVHQCESYNKLYSRGWAKSTHFQNCLRDQPWFFTAFPRHCFHKVWCGLSLSSSFQIIRLSSNY
jgi:hypothetical protein